LQSNAQLVKEEGSPAFGRILYPSRIAAVARRISMAARPVPRGGVIAFSAAALRRNCVWHFGKKDTALRDYP